MRISDIDTFVAHNQGDMTVEVQEEGKSDYGAILCLTEEQKEIVTQLIRGKRSEARRAWEDIKSRRTTRARSQKIFAAMDELLKQLTEQ